MLILNIKRVLRLRGIEKHYNFLLGLNFVPSTAHNFLKGAVGQIKFEQLEQLCLALNCTPNDLFEWRPEANRAVADTHSLNNLKKKTEKDLPELLGEVPLERFEQIVDILQDLKKQ